MATSEFVKDVTTDAFMQDVMEQSQTVPVVVDFWSPRCGPCMQLGPILEKLADEYQGRFILAKVQTDTEPQLAQAFRVSSIPMVVAIANGEAVDQFVGLQPEPVLREWLDRFVPGGEEDPMTTAAALESTDPGAAEAIYREQLATDSDNAPASIGLARSLMLQEQYSDSQAILDELAKRGFLEPEAEQLKSQLAIKVAAAESGGVKAAREALAESPDDSEKKLHLAEALAGDGAHDEACGLCLEVYAAEKSDAARDTLLKILDVMPAESEAAIGYRRQLANLMY